ncbi:transposase [Streptomyces sp. APSN-46.1]|uniref:IS701 family transposase n=1 Tax=Streptomyces sp. APSN-46.1 TaxID=2929049 RepID=UPI001FB46804|nr:transposase [Streptomyces sp. APSN-46.1]MCJ1678530.1 transposase [Streptomyces sp. APSN-46.1]
MQLVYEEHEAQVGHRVPDGALGRLCAEIFAPLPRSDQRRKGELYLRGLLSAGGRKSMRNIATHVGDRAAEQSLHHFISASTWDWNPVRAALAQYLERTLRPRAWVVHPVVIPKAGRHTVGVARRFVPRLGQVVNSQEAFGVWAANEETSSPVTWRLTLSEDWRDGDRLGPAPVPDDARLAATPLECVAGAASEVRSWTGGTPRPVVADLPDISPAAVARSFAAAGMPYLASVHGSTAVVPAAPAVLGHDGRGTSAHQLLRMVRTLRRPVTWCDPASPASRTSLVAGVRVRLPGVHRPLLLLGEWTGPSGWPQRCWLTDMTEVPWGALLRLAKLTHRVETDFSEVATHVGVVDFEGRSFGGWHRHTTLASAAHVLSAEYRDRDPHPQPMARPA